MNMSDSDGSTMAESWEYTRGYAGVFGRPPAPFVAAVRCLLTQHAEGASEASGSTRYQILRLLKSPSLFSPLYFAASAFTATTISSSRRTSESDLLKAFLPDEAASLLALVYLWRRASSICDGEELRFIEDTLVDPMNLGFLVGRAIPSIGAGLSVLQAAIPILGLTAFLSHDPQGFKEYRRLVRRQGGGWDCSLEIKRWGCTRIQVGAVLVQSLGFGTKRSNAIANVLGGQAESGQEEEDGNLEKDVQMAALWCQCLSTTGKAPEIALAAKYYPTHAALQDTLSTFSMLRQDRGQSCWIQKRKEDLPPHQLGQTAPHENTTEDTDEFENL